MAVVALLLGMIHLGRPGLSADEGSTKAAVALPWRDLASVLHHMDLVHGTYYALLHLWVDVAGSSAFAVRLPSAVCIAGACGLVAAVAQRLDDRRTGWYAGAASLTVPGLSWPGLDARPAALAVLLAVLATWLLIRADALPTRADALPSRSRWAAYALCLVALALTQVTALLIVLPHALLVTRAVRRRWLGWTAAALVVLVPFVIAGRRQAEQVAWLTNGASDVVSALGGHLTAGPAPTGAPAYASGVLLIALLALAGVGVAARSTARGALVMWALGPPLLLLAPSLVGSSMYAERYVAWCLPAYALLVGRGLARLPGRAALIAVATLALSAVPAWSAQRTLDAKGWERTAELAAVVHTVERQGGAVVFLDTSTRTLAAAYPEAFVGLTDLSRAPVPPRPTALMLPDVPDADALAAVRRTHPRTVVVVYRNRAPWTGRAEMRVLARSGCALTHTETGSRNAVALWTCS
ncbi:hypothetical protein VV01_17055 [Luteipulveratus halotolerans]|uniref:Uncharacterized protein n=1 Tax=Luteipulveratus halotolerans TaxID=1631356 RepID=A0A0L6CL09_9MICO|nr:hypothetical protein VV01_17055 [Luteipulveratus halotolerans]